MQTVTNEILCHLQQLKSLNGHYATKEQKHFVLNCIEKYDNILEKHVEIEVRCHYTGVTADKTRQCPIQLKEG